LREWLFYSRSGVGVGLTNYLGLGSGVGMGANNFLGVDLGVDFLLSVFFILLFYTLTEHP
jgi:hypothetical protein